MGMRISTNTSAINAHRNLERTQTAEDKTMSHLSTGSRIAEAGDDAAGYSVSTSLNANIRSTQAALRNTNDGISMVQVAEGAVSTISEMLVRMRELGIQASSDTISDTERRMINREVHQAKSEIDRIVATTDYNGKKILNGGGTWPGFDVQVGIHADEHNQLGVDRRKFNFNSDHIGLHGLDFSSKESAREHLADLDFAIERVSSYRSTLGALQSRFSTIASGLGSSELNLTAANSRIKDADIASETSDMAKNKILREAGTAVLTQANTQPQQALKLIG
jgi:flagellin